VAEAKAISKLGTRSSSSSFREVPDDIDAIWKEVRRLSKRQVQVITLRYLEDLTFSEIAEVLGCSKEAVNIHFRRARRILARRLGIREDQ
jgi:RNA polymerase sigma-70 factor (ECF subfamily)